MKRLITCLTLFFLLGVGSELLAQNTGSDSFSSLANFGSRPKDTYNQLTSTNGIFTIVANSGTKQDGTTTNVEGQTSDAKMQLGSSLTISTNSDVYINSIVVSTGQSNRNLTSTPEAVISNVTTTWTYTYSGTDVKTVTLTNPNTNSNNINVSSISVNYTETVSNTYSWTYNTTTKYWEDEYASTPDNNEGKWLFSGAGNLKGGTQITEVPGIVTTIGASDDEYTWSVTNDLYATAPKVNDKCVTGRSSSNNYCPTGGCFIKFEPYVNGYLKIYGTVYGGFGGGSKGDFQSADGVELVIFSTSQTSDPVIEKPILAGKTYYLYSQSYPLLFKGFSFRPAFMIPGKTATELYDLGSTAEQTESMTFTAKVGTESPNGYPLMVDPSVDNTYYSPSGDRDIVTLANNGGVDLSGNGTCWIYGNVIAKGNPNNTLTAAFKLTTSTLKLQTTNPENGATGLTEVNGNVVKFKFDQAITINPGAIARIRVNTTEYVYDVNSRHINIESSDNKTLNISFDTDIAGTGDVVKVTIEKGSVSASSDNSLQNTKEEIEFSFTNDGPELKMIYPTAVNSANVGTSIVVDAILMNDQNENINLSEEAVVVGYLKKDGEDGEGMAITATYDQHNLVFKPTSTLEPNTHYTLYVAGNQVTMSNTTQTKVTRDRAFDFTTGNASGSAPQLLNTTPANGTIGVSYSTNRIWMHFDQNLEIEPYSRVDATPINGSEATSHGEFKFEENTSSNTLLLDATDKKKLYFDVPSDGLKYDLWYNLVIPANTVTGTGGMPNTQDIVVTFKMESNPNASTSFSGYPWTWDFRAISDATFTLLDSSNTNKLNSSYKNTNGWWEKYEDGYRSYPNTGQGKYLDQGNSLHIRTNNDSYTEIPETQGLRISMMTNRTNQLRIYRDNLHLNGNTNYITVPNLKKGDKLYIVARANGFFRINTPYAEFIQGAKADDETKQDGMTSASGGDFQVYIVQLNDDFEGDKYDVSFCCNNVAFKAIAVAVTEERLFKSQFSLDGKSYTTDCQDQPIRYELTKYFTTKETSTVNGKTAVRPNSGDDVKGYYIGSYDPSTKSANSVAVDCAPASAGTILIMEKTISENTNVSLFRADVNTKADESTNLLVGTVEGINNLDNTDGNYYFFSNIYRTLTEDLTAFDESAEWQNGSKMGFYRAVGSKVSAHKAYLDLSSVGGAGVNMVYLDYNEETDGISDLKAPKSENGDVYSITGVKVQHPTKGLYIINGKKVIIK